MRSDGTFSLALLFLSLSSLAADVASVDTKSERSTASVTGWANESSVGITVNGGNSQSQSYLARQTTSYSWTDDMVGSSGHYLYGKADGVDVARNWDIGLRYAHFFTDNFAGLLGNTWEGDTFAGLDHRTSIDAGAKYYFFGRDTKNDYLLNETGYRYQYEVRVPGQPLRYLNNHFIRVYFDGKKSISEAVFVRLWVELLPNLNRTQHYMINFEPSLGVMLTKVLSLKLAFTGRYDDSRRSGKRTSTTSTPPHW